MNDTITPEENQRISREFSKFTVSHPEYIATQRNTTLLGSTLEELAAQVGESFQITAETLAQALDILVKSGRIEVAALPQKKTEEAPVEGRFQQFLSNIESNDPHDVVAAQKETARRQAARKAAEDAELALRQKAAQEIFGRGSKPQEEKPQHIPDSLMSADPAEESRVLQMYDAPEIRHYLERKSFLRAGR